MGEAKTFELQLEMEEGEPLGATPNDKLIITKVQAGTLADGKLKVGDQILEVNDTKMTDTNSFFRALRFGSIQGVVTLRVCRDEKKVEELEQRCHIPADREKLIQRRDGFSYFVAKLVWQQGGPKLGLGIKHYQNRVLVSRCDANSLAAQQLLTGDHIVDVDTSPVTDKDVARDLLIKGLQRSGQITMVIERPETAEAKMWTKQALTAQTTSLPPSVQMNSDVRAIAQREKTKLKSQPAQSILRPGVLDKRVAINENIGSHVIASDNEGRALRPVKK